MAQLIKDGPWSGNLFSRMLSRIEHLAVQVEHQRREKERYKANARRWMAAEQELQRRVLQADAALRAAGYQPVADWAAKEEAQEEKAFNAMRYRQMVEGGHVKPYEGGALDMGQVAASVAGFVADANHTDEGGE